MTLDLFASKTAIVKGVYRYHITRTLAPGPHILFVMLNPSTADAEKDDPTIRKCIGFTRRLGFNGFGVVNLYALRATDPRELYRHPEPVGTENDATIIEGIKKAARVIVAWGADAGPSGAARVASVYCSAFQFQKPLLALGVCKNGNPRHPLMLGYDARPTPWRVP